MALTAHKKQLLAIYQDSVLIGFANEYDLITYNCGQLYVKIEKLRLASKSIDINQHIFIKYEGGENECIIHEFGFITDFFCREHILHHTLKLEIINK